MQKKSDISSVSLSESDTPSVSLSGGRLPSAAAVREAIAESDTMTVSLSGGRAKGRFGRRVSLPAKLAVAVVVVLALTGGTAAWAMMYYPVDYAWYNEGVETGEYHIATQGELTAFSTIVNGTWQAEEIEGGHVALSDEAKASLRAKDGVADDFAGASVSLDASVIGFFGSTDGLPIDRPTMTPIGTADRPFNGTFDGNGHEITGLKISNLVEDNFQGDDEYGPDPVPPLQYAGLFGHVGPQGSVRNLALGRGCSLALAADQPTDRIAYVGSIAGYCEGTLENVTSQADVSITWDDGEGGDGRYSAGDYARAYVIDGVGGIAGYCDGDVTGATFKGGVDVTTPANAAWVAETREDEAVVVRYVGGVVGRSGGDPAAAGIAGERYGTIANCVNAGDVTVATTGAGGTDRFGETVDSKSQYVGGIAGYAVGNIDGCTNSAAIVASSYAYDKNKSESENLKGFKDADGGADSCGGIVGGFRSASSTGMLNTPAETEQADKQAFYDKGAHVDRGIVGAARSNASNVIAISNCTNLGSVISCNNVGGIAGSTGTYTRVDGCANGDAKKYRQDDSIGNVLSVRWNKPNTGGLVGRCYGDISYSRNHGEVATAKIGYFVGGLAGDLYFYRDSGGKKYLTPEVYGCYSTGQIATSNSFRRGALLGGNGGYIHDCLFLFGTSTASEDEEVAAIGYAQSDDAPLASRISVAYASDSQAAEHGSEAFSMKSSQAVAWLNNSAMKVDAISGETGWESGRYYLATPAANSGYPVLKRENPATNAVIDLSKLAPAVTLVDDASFTTAYNPTPKLNVQITLSGKTQTLVENADYYVVPDACALNDKGICKGLSDGREYTAGACGIGNYTGSFGSVAYAIGKGSFEECTVDAASGVFTGYAYEYHPGESGDGLIQVNVLDPAGQLVNPDDYTVNVNDGGACTNPSTYSIVVNATARSYYAGKCEGSFAIERVSIASDCDVIGVTYDEAADGGIEDAAELGIVSNPRIWFYNDEVYKLYEVEFAQLDSDGTPACYGESDVAEFKAKRASGETMQVDGQDVAIIDPDTPDNVLEALSGYPKVKGLRVYRDQDNGRFLTAATPKVDSNGDEVPDEYGMELEYTAGELSPQVIGVNWNRGKLGSTLDQAKVGPAYQVIYGGGETGSKNIETSVTGTIVVARNGSFTENYDQLTFDIGQARIDMGAGEVDAAKAARLSARIDSTTRVFREGSDVDPAFEVFYNGNEVAPSNYEASILDVQNGGQKVARRTSFIEGDTIFYQVKFREAGSILYGTALSGNELSCTVVKDKKPVTASSIEVEFEGDRWERNVDGVWEGTFDLETGIPKPSVKVYYTGEGDRTLLTEGVDYVLQYQDWRYPGYRDAAADEVAVSNHVQRPDVVVSGKNGYSGTYHCWYRVNRAVIDQGQLSRLAAGEIAGACIANVKDRSYRYVGLEAEPWLSQYGPYFPYAPDGYDAIELQERLGITFFCSAEWGGQTDCDLFAVEEIRNGDGKAVQRATNPGIYTLKLRRTASAGYGKFQTAFNVFCDVAEGATAYAQVQIVECNLSQNLYEDGAGKSVVLNMLDRGSAYLVNPEASNPNGAKGYWLYDNHEFPYTGKPVQPRYMILDGHLPATSRQKVSDGETTRLESDDEVVARLLPHAFDYGQYEAVVQGYAAQGGPIEPGTGYQVLSIQPTASGSGFLTGSLSILTQNLPVNVFSVVAADISNPAIVGIRIGDAGQVNEPETNVGWIGNGGARPTVHFFVDVDGSGTYDEDEECSYVEAADGVESPDYSVEYFDNDDVTVGATATARITVLNEQHLCCDNATGEDADGHSYFDVHFGVEGKTVALDDDSEVSWSGVSTQLALADADAGILSQPAATASYRQAGEDVVVPESAYELIVGYVELIGEDEVFHEQAAGWSEGDCACIAVKDSGFARFTMDSEEPYVIARNVEVVAVDDAHSFSAGSGIELSLAQTTFVYDGASHEPAVFAHAGETELRPGVDFRVAYVANTLAGTAQVQVHGIGAYSGERTLDFEIQKLDLALCDVSVADKPYTGAQVKPSANDVKVLYRGREIASVLQSDAEELLQWKLDESAYGENVNAGAHVGTLAIVAADSGNLSGCVQAAFSITGTLLSSCSVADAQPGKEVPAGALGFTAADFTSADFDIRDTTRGEKLVLGQDFVVAGVSNADGYANATGDSGSVSYLGYATVTLAGTGNYSGSLNVNIPIEKRSIADAELRFDESYGEGALSLEYAGKQLKPAIQVRLDGVLLEANRDYVANYRNNTDVGAAIVSVTGVGQYKDTANRTLSFEITPVEVGASGSSLSLASDEVAYTGEGVNPGASLTLRGEKIAAKNVQLSYASVGSSESGSADSQDAVALESAPVEPGSYRVTATAVSGNLRGSASRDFRIVKADLADAKLSVAGAHYAFGEEVQPAVTLVFADGSLALDAAQGCSTTWRSDAEGGTWNVGDACTAIVTASGESAHFTGSAAVAYKVTRIPVTRADVGFADYTELPYTGSDVLPDFDIVVGGRTLRNGEDYAVAALSDDLVNPGVKQLQVTTPDTSVYEARNVLVSYEVKKSETKTDLIVPGTAPAAKKANDLEAQAKKKTVKVKYKKVKKKKQVVKNLKVSGAQGQVTYKNASTQKKAKKFKVNAKGALTVPKKTKKGTYTVKIQVTASGDASHDPSTKVVTFKVKVK